MSSSKGRASLLLACAIALASSTARADTPAWQEGQPIPAGYHRVPRTQRTLAWTGASIFFAAYIASAAAAASSFTSDASSDTTRGALWVPVAGPFVQLGSTSSAGLDTLLVVDGLAQITGLTLLVWGEAKQAGSLVPDAPQIAIAPMATRGGSGFALTGRF